MSLWRKASSSPRRSPVPEATATGASNSVPTAAETSLSSSPVVSVAFPALKSSADQRAALDLWRESAYGPPNGRSCVRCKKRGPQICRIAASIRDRCAYPPATSRWLSQCDEGEDRDAATPNFRNQVEPAMRCVCHGSPRPDALFRRFQPNLTEALDSNSSVGKGGRGGLS